jgi:hypothetical protein
MGVRIGQVSVTGVARVTVPAAKVIGDVEDVPLKSEKLAPMESAAIAPTPTTALRACANR